MKILTVKTIFDVKHFPQFIGSDRKIVVNSQYSIPSH